MYAPNSTNAYLTRLLRSLSLSLSFSHARSPNTSISLKLKLLCSYRCVLIYIYTYTGASAPRWLTAAVASIFPRRFRSSTHFLPLVVVVVAIRLASHWRRALLALRASEPLDSSSPSLLLLLRPSLARRCSSTTFFLSVSRCLTRARARLSVLDRLASTLLRGAYCSSGRSPTSPATTMMA